ncbi:competence protein CoiA family protein [Clostridium botulinum]
MSLDNVQLWFAKDKDNKIVTINEVYKENKEKYYCPLCNSEVLARTGRIKSWCFAHIDKSRCSSESMYHFWIKNKLLQKGDKFKIQTNIEKEYICEEILVEETYKVGDKEYRPDLTAKTTSGDTIYFEMNYSNKKKLEDYLDIWIGLGNVVVEIDVKTLINSESGKLPIFKAKYYKAKCFNVKKGEDKIYHDTIGEYKEKLINNEGYNDKKKKEVEKLDWFWKDIQRYRINEVDIEHISELIHSIEDKDSQNIVVNILKKSSCQNVIKDYVGYHKKRTKNIIDSINDKIKYDDINIPYKIYDRLFNLKASFKYKSSGYISLNVNLLNKDYIIDTINNINDEIKEEKEINKMIDRLQRYAKDNYDYNGLCKNINLENEPRINKYKVKHYKPTIYGVKNKYRLYFNNFSKANYSEYIAIENYEDENKIQEIIKKKASYNTYELFSKRDILKIDDIALRLSKKYKEIDNNIDLSFNIYEKKHINITITYGDDFTEAIKISKDRYFHAIDLYKYLYLLIGLKINQIKKYIKKTKFINKLTKDINKKIKNNDLSKKWEIVFLHTYHLKSGSIYIYKNNKYMFDVCSDIIDKYLKTDKISDKFLSKKINDIVKHKIYEYVYNEKRISKYAKDFYNIRSYKNKILKNLKKSNFNILKIQPMCNNPYIGLKYANNIKQIIFLSKHDYNNCKIDTSDYNVVTILNKNVELKPVYYEDVKDYVITNFEDEKYDFINKNQLVKLIIVNKINKEQYDYNKNINLFYYKSKPKDKKYKNLNKFNFVKATDMLRFINKKYLTISSYEEIKDIVLKTPYYISNTEFNELKELILSQEEVYGFVNLFLKTIRNIKDDQINILLNIRYTNLYDNGYQPWLIEDFIEELRALGFNNVSNTKEEE